MLEVLLAALAEVGTVAAVPALRARQGRLGLLQTRLARAFDQAVARIQQRAGGERGELALAAGPADSGKLSLVALERDP